MAWRPYLKDRLIDDRPEGFSVIVPADMPEIVPLACPMCTYVLRSWEDEAAYRGFGCCDWCARQWAHPRREEWKAGWRPDPGLVREAALERPSLSIVFEVA